MVSICTVRSWIGPMVFKNWIDRLYQPYQVASQEGRRCPAPDDPVHVGELEPHLVPILLFGVYKTCEVFNQCIFLTYHRFIKVYGLGHVADLVSVLRRLGGFSAFPPLANFAPRAKLFAVLPKKKGAHLGIFVVFKEAFFVKVRRTGCIPIL